MLAGTSTNYKHGSTLDRETAQQFLAALQPAGGVVELRCPGYPRGKATTAGFYDDPSKLLDAVARFNGRCNCYVTLNAVNPALLALANNRIIEYIEHTTADADIIRRTGLVIDVDPRRPAGIPSTEAEHAEALSVVDKIRDFLTSQGWPSPLHADTGNGAELIYGISLANNDGARDQLKRCLLALAARFDNDMVHVDTGMFNAARIVRLIGTKNCKGDGTADRPHRLSRLLDVPNKLSAVPGDLLGSLARMAPPEEPPRSQYQAHNGIAAEDFLRKHGLATSKVKPWQAGTLYELETCPFNEAHKRTARMVQFSSGALQFGCFHAGCQGQDWHALRNLLEPGWRDERRKSSDETSKKRGNSRVSSLPKSGKTPPRRLPTYQPFPLAALPPILREYVDASAAAIGCDPALVALPGLAVVAGCIGNARAIRLKRGWTEPSILWDVTVAASGAQKSPAWAAAVDPMMAIQMELVDAAEAPAKPIYHITSDATIEAVGENLRDNHRGLLLARDELDGWLQSLTRHREGRGTDRPLWLELHRAGTLRVDRLTRARGPLSVRRANCSICGTIQPLVLARAFDDEALAAGLAARFLMAAPPLRRKHWNEAEVHEDLTKRYQDLLRDLLALDLADQQERRPHVVELDAAAKDFWVRWYNRWAEQQYESRAEQHALLAKLEGGAARLALLHHVVGYAAAGLRPEVIFDGEGGFCQRPRDTIPIGERSMQAGITLAEWFANEAMRIYQTLRETEAEREQRSLLEWIDGRGGQTTARELWRSLHSRYLIVDDAEATLAALVEAGYGKWIDRPPGPQGGRPTRIFTIVGDETSKSPQFSGVSSPTSQEPPPNGREPGEEG
jgi:hypothetical protein